VGHLAAKNHENWRILTIKYSAQPFDLFVVICFAFLPIVALTGLKICYPFGRAGSSPAATKTFFLSPLSPETSSGSNE